jgi:hypothetical protein
MAPVGTLERTTFDCARCGGTIDRSSRPRTCPHCQAKKADRCQFCDRAVYIGAPRCPEHAVLAADEPDRATVMLPSAPLMTLAPASPAPRWVAAVARTAIAVSLLVPVVWAVRNQTALRSAHSFQDLGVLLVDDVPSYTRVDDAQAGSGPVDFERAVRDDVEGAASRQTLTDAGLVRGYDRAWQQGSADNETVDVELFQYRDHRGAVLDEARLERLVPQVATANQLSWSTFPVPTVPGAHGYSLVASGGGVSVEVVSFTRGPYSAAVSVTSVDQDTARSVATRAAERQRSRFSKAERLELLVTDAFRTVRR